MTQLLLISISLVLIAIFLVIVMIKLINIENRVKSLNADIAKRTHDIMTRINASEVDIRKEIIKVKHIVDSTHLSVNTVNNKQGRLINDIDNVNRAIKKVAKIGSIRFGNDFDKDFTELYRQITEKPKSAQNKHNNK
ncbi:MAG: hypothetical protein KNU04_gp45 [crAssphage sp. isolate ctbg_1]|uniref:Uncharacterized protein n=1 Tax=crAssphage sp. isolate ctbg_1 TaxID=2989854 RepID=A0A345MT29_9CAUD|nr:MAG: hypothetical protein KNU04_gp45 [crAssphage sp. isolate ctbg_1]AXH74529.1 MAG: hypothetical protein [crAssphage sp. isolate ctbg_1]